MSYIGVAASGNFLVATNDNHLHRFGVLEGDVAGTLAATIVSGIAGTPVEQVIPASNDVLQFDGSNWTPQSITTGAHALLSATHTDTNDYTVLQGSIVVGTGTVPAWGGLNLGTQEFVLYSDGTDAVYTRLGPNTPFTLGSVGAPSHTFTGDLDTGLSAATADVLIASASGQAIITMTSADDGQILTLDAAQVVRSRDAGINLSMFNDDYLIYCTATSITIDLPVGPVTNQVVVVKDRDGNASGGARITIDGNGNTIDGNTAVTIGSAYGAFTFIYNGTEWNII
ncbi:MAG: hypothetical protein ACXABY_02300 [Candidatus Thorarchaeota archaeon]|jgi:hypothetical protein